MHALNALPATLIYPTVGTVGVALNVILARQLWRERLLPRQVLGVVVALLVVLLMNLHGSDAKKLRDGEGATDGPPVERPVAPVADAQRTSSHYLHPCRRAVTKLVLTYAVAPDRLVVGDPRRQELQLRP